MNFSNNAEIIIYNVQLYFEIFFMLKNTSPT